MRRAGRRHGPFPFPGNPPSRQRSLPVRAETDPESRAGAGSVAPAFAGAIERGLSPACGDRDARSNTYRIARECARCERSNSRLLNGLVSGGLAMGAQTIEKFLKAFILLKNPGEAVRKLQHSLTDLLTAADQLSPALGLSKYAALTDRFECYYRSRYPDNPNPPTAMYSAEIVELDEFIIFINDNMPCPFEVKYRTGLYALVTFSLQHGRTVAPWEGWIKERNRALVPRWSQIEADFRTVLKNLHPDNFG